MSSTAVMIGQTGGRIAGGLLFGAIGTAVGGPVGGWIGRAIGSRVGAMAGAAAAEAIESYMEDANAKAEEETKDQPQAKPCVDCGEIDCFNPPEGSTPEQVEEFKRQLKEQQDAINEIPPDKLLDNMANYAQNGRGAQDAIDRATARNNWSDNRTLDLVEEGIEESAARAMAQKEMSTMDVIHTPDLSAGGTGRTSDVNGGLGPRSPNRSIGSQWSKSGPGSDKTRLEQLEQHAEKAKEKGEGMNADLKICNDGGDSSPSGETPGSSGTPSGGSGQGQGNIPTS